MAIEPRQERKGALTRQNILRKAADLASIEGLEGVTLGRLATVLGMSKSGLFAHFGSKEELQLATVETAMAIVYARLEGAVGQKHGLAALRAIIESWLDYIEERTFPGGCFFHQAASEVDAHPGPVRDQVAAFLGFQRETFLTFAREAQEAGELAASLDLEQLVFEIQAFGAAANGMLILFDDATAVARARRAVAERLGDS